jgi:hypothetical protein
MGIGNYFKAKKPAPPAPVEVSEKPASVSPHASYNTEFQIWIIEKFDLEPLDTKFHVPR